jgi:hypothetical protein
VYKKYKQWATKYYTENKKYKQSATKYYTENNKYKITAVLKVETDMIPNITESLTGQAVILVIMYVKTFNPHFSANIIYGIANNYTSTQATFVLLQMKTQPHH